MAQYINEQNTDTVSPGVTFFLTEKRQFTLKSTHSVITVMGFSCSVVACLHTDIIHNCSYRQLFSFADILMVDLIALMVSSAVNLRYHYLLSKV